MSCACEDALAALSARLGLPLEFDDKACSLHIAEQPVTIRREEEPDRLVVSALVADDLPDAPSRALVCDLLDLGFDMLGNGLPAVARDPETGFIAVFAIFPCATLVASEFPDAFEKFVAFATSLADRFDDERAGYPAAADRAADDTAAPPLGADGLLTV